MYNCFKLYFAFCKLQWFWLNTYFCCNTTVFHNCNLSYPNMRITQSDGVERRQSSPFYSAQYRWYSINAIVFSYHQFNDKTSLYCFVLLNCDFCKVNQDFVLHGEPPQNSDGTNLQTQSVESFQAYNCPSGHLWKLHKPWKVTRVHLGNRTRHLQVEPLWHRGQLPSPSVQQLPISRLGDSKDSRNQPTIQWEPENMSTSFY